MEKEKEKGAVEANASVPQELDIDDTPFLCAELYFDVVLSKSHVAPHGLMHLPARIICKLPRAKVPIVLRCRRKNWDLYYLGNSSNPRLDKSWKDFVNDNHLKVGDACVFELLENSPSLIKFKVHILRGDLPPELAEAVDAYGSSFEHPIQVD